MSLNKRIFVSGDSAVSLDDTNPLGQATDTLEAFYDFNGDFEDSSGHNNDATNTANGIVTSTYLEIDGVGNDYITLGRNYSIGESASFWFQIPSEPSATSYYRILAQDGGSYYPWDYVTIDWNDTNDTLVLGHYARWTYGYSYKSTVIDSNFTFGEWHFLALNFTAFNTTKYSYDGGDLTTMTAITGSNGSTFYSNGPYVGKIFSNNATFYTTDAYYLDKLRIFSDELTQAQIDTLYTETPGT